MNDNHNPPTDIAKSLGRWMFIALWLLLLGAGSWFAQRWLDRSRAQEPVVVTGTDGRSAVELDADRWGHYQVTGEIDGQAVAFLIDTGASEISLPASVAARLGLKRGQKFPVSTANGSVTVYATRIDEVRLGTLRLNDVRAHINPGMDGDVALLGMSFLRNFELVQRSGRLTIREP